eukprot:scpid101884/ scgid23346/ 
MDVEKLPLTQTSLCVDQVEQIAGDAGEAASDCSTCAANRAQRKVFLKQFALILVLLIVQLALCFVGYRQLEAGAGNILARQPDIKSNVRARLEPGQPQQTVIDLNSKLQGMPEDLKPIMTSILSRVNGVHSTGKDAVTVVERHSRSGETHPEEDEILSVDAVIVTLRSSSVPQRLSPRLFVLVIANLLALLTLVVHSHVTMDARH